MSLTFDLYVGRGSRLSGAGRLLLMEYTKQVCITKPGMPRANSSVTCFDEGVGSRCDLQAAEEIYFRFASCGIQLDIKCHRCGICSGNLKRSGCTHWAVPNVRINKKDSPVEIPTSISYRYSCRKCRGSDLAFIPFGSDVGHYCWGCGCRDFELDRPKES